MQARAILRYDYLLAECSNLSTRECSIMLERVSLLTENHIMETLSRAYVQAIAGGAGLNLKLEQTAREFDYGVDGTFHPIKPLQGKLVESGFPLDFQVKATTNWTLDSTHVIHSMKAIAYNKMVDRNNEKGATPKLLILMCLPKETMRWLETDEDRLLLRKCCYWERLTGDLTNNLDNITIRIPRNQRLIPEMVVELLAKVKSGEWR
jgi:hypothetical protein